MTETEKKALALVNEVLAERRLPLYDEEDVAANLYTIAALCRAIEQHEAFKQKVSDSLEHYLDQWRHSTPSREVFACQFGDFIIPKPDPLVEAVKDVWGYYTRNAAEVDASRLRAALADRGLEVRKIGEGE